MATITRTEFTAGTFVKGMNGNVGVVAGWVKSSIVIRWNEGGSSSFPASHGGLTVAKYVCRDCHLPIWDDVTDHGMVAHR